VRSRAHAVAAACLLALAAARAGADPIDQQAGQLRGTSYKVRLAAALSLAKSKDPRAVIALAGALDRDEDATIRRVSALALEKIVTAQTADDARELAFASLEKAASSDGDSKVRDTAVKALKTLAPLRREHKPTQHGDKPEVFINVDITIDVSKKAPSDANDRVTKIVRRNVEKTGYATAWPGGLPTSAELSSNGSRAFIVASTVKQIDISTQGGKTEIACTVVVRVAPWLGKDAGEKWESNKSASASGSAKATTSSSDRAVASGVRECLEAVAEDVTARQVVPFIKRIAQAGG
jgi:hypothetical protein